MIVYVAGKFEEVERVREVQDILMRCGHIIAFDWTRRNAIVSENMSTAENALLDMNAVRRSDAALKAPSSGPGLEPLSATITKGAPAKEHCSARQSAALWDI